MMYPNSLRDAPSQHAINCAHAKILKHDELEKRMVALLISLVKFEDRSVYPERISAIAEELLQEYFSE